VYLSRKEVRKYDLKKIKTTTTGGEWGINSKRRFITKKSDGKKKEGETWGDFYI